MGEGRKRPQQVRGVAAGKKGKQKLTSGSPGVEEAVVGKATLVSKWICGYHPPCWSCPGHLALTGGLPCARQGLVPFHITSPNPHYRPKKEAKGTVRLRR